jgi:hypothetical protein
MSQSVNLRWGNDPDHLVNIMDNPAAVKLFAGMSILCVGEGYIPEQNEDRMVQFTLADLFWHVLIFMLPTGCDEQIR